MTVGVQQRFIAKIAPDDGTLDGCWNWIGAKGRGYGLFWLNGRNQQAHRVGWMLAGKTIPDGLQLDHLCRNRACVRPSHLEPVTHRVNTLRGDTITARESTATECINGHPFDEENTYRWRGHRLCRECRNAASRRYRAAAEGES